MKKTFSKYFFQIFTDLYFCEYSKGDGLTKQNLNLNFDRIHGLYSKYQGLIFLALTPKILCKDHMNNSYAFSFLTGINYPFRMVLANRDEVIQYYFKAGLSYNEILSVLSAHHNVSLSLRQLKRILKKWLYREESQKAQSTMFLCLLQIN